MSMPNSAAHRLQKDYKQLVEDPIPGLAAVPNPENVLDWYFVISGPTDTPYEGGYFLGSLKFPPEYPFKGPRLMLHTPNGRFAINTRVCLSVTDYHEEQWNPTWNVGSILNAVISFMTGDELTYGAIRTSVDERKAFADQSLAWCLNNEDFKKFFGSLATSIEQELKSENRYDAAMAEYARLKIERARHPAALNGGDVFDDLNMIRAQHMAMNARRAQVGMELAMRRQERAARVAQGGGADPDVVPVGDPAMARHAEFMRLFQQRAAVRAPPRGEENGMDFEGVWDERRNLDEFLVQFPLEEINLPPMQLAGARIDVMLPVGPRPPPEQVEVHDEMLHLEERERMEAILATHVAEIEKMNQETIERIRTKKPDAEDNGSGSGESGDNLASGTGASSSSDSPV